MVKVIPVNPADGRVRGTDFQVFVQAAQRERRSRNRVDHEKHAAARILCLRARQPNDLIGLDIVRGEVCRR